MLSITADTLHGLMVVVEQVVVVVVVVVVEQAVVMVWQLKGYVDVVSEEVVMEWTKLRSVATVRYQHQHATPLSHTQPAHFDTHFIVYLDTGIVVWRTYGFGLLQWRAFTTQNLNSTSTRSALVTRNCSRILALFLFLGTVSHLYDMIASDRGSVTKRINIVVIPR
jgi:hypothetical protein